MNRVVTALKSQLRCLCTRLSISLHMFGSSAPNRAKIGVALALLPTGIIITAAWAGFWPMAIWDL
jgi:hypothetical protein